MWCFVTMITAQNDGRTDTHTHI